LDKDSPCRLDVYKPARSSSQTPESPFQNHPYFNLSNLISYKDVCGLISGNRKLSPLYPSNKKRYIFGFLTDSIGVTVRDQQQTSNGNGSMTAATTTTTSATQNKTEYNTSQNLDSNLKTLLEFKRSLLEEQRKSEQEIQELNSRIEETKKSIDAGRDQLDNLRTQLKRVNEQKDAEYVKFKELKNSLMETRNEMKNLDTKSTLGANMKSRKDRFDMVHLGRVLEQIEHDIQTKKLTKDEERRLVAKSKEVATKLHNLRVINKKEDKYRNVLSQYESIKAVMNRIFDKKSEFGNKIGSIKKELDKLMNLRESLYEDRRKTIHAIREASAKLEMVDTQLNAIEFRRSRAQASGHRQRKKREYEGRRENRYEATQERARRSKENQEKWNTLKEEALRKMSSGEKLTFDEMKLIYGDSGP
jgi:uncharacterized coiled-coil DUF342 family protein